MDVTSFCAQSRVVIVAGKGGVGKTTVSAALSRMAARAGLSVLLVELEGKPGIAGAFGGQGPLDYRGADVHQGPAAAGTVRARCITPDDALLEYLADHGLHRVSRRLVSSGVIDVVATAIPGIRDVLVLGKVKQLERDRVADLIVVDAPATGHAVTFLTSAGGLLDAARGGPVRAQAADVVELLHDPARCRVLLVTLPEELPVSETVEAAYTLEDRAGVQLGPVVVNACDDPPAGLSLPTADAAELAGVALPVDRLDALEAARRFRVHRHQLQTEEIERLRQELPLPQLRLPELMSPTVGPADLDVLAAALERGVAALTVEVA
jgi:anion-transporting  ArsA/GET3 family ATPase